MTRKDKASSNFHETSRLTLDAFNGLLDVVEDAHYSIGTLGGIIRKNEVGKTSGIARLVYQCIRTVSALLSKGVEMVPEDLISAKESTKSPSFETLQAALNGVVGDYLVQKQSNLAIPMQLKQKGKSIDLDSPGFSTSIEMSDGKILMMIHGCCMNDLQWKRKGHDHGALLSETFNLTPLYLHYNTGLHISENGSELSNTLEKLISKQRVKEIVILAHSMGGLVARSACQYAKESQHSWLDKLKKIIFLGTPHHGAPLERIGNWVDRSLAVSVLSRPFARLGKVRSTGITDLRYGNLMEQDWKHFDRFEHVGDLRIPVPLPKNVDCYAIAAMTTNMQSKVVDSLVGDGLVTVESALGKHRDPEKTLNIPKERQWIGKRMAHLDLLNDQSVYNTLRQWMKD